MSRPTAAPAIWPYPHRTMAEVLRREEHCWHMQAVRRAKQFGYEEAAE